MLLQGLLAAKSLQLKKFILFSDSQLTKKQIEGQFETKDISIAKYKNKVNTLIPIFEKVSVEKIPRNKMRLAYALAFLGSVIPKAYQRKFKIRILERSTINEPDTNNVITQSSNVTFAEEEGTWIKGIFSYLESKTLPDDPQYARNIKTKTTRYQLLDSDMCRNTYLGPLLS